MKYVPELTGLRGLAALMVFISHLSKDGLLTPIYGRCFSIQGVILFFILSGFLMGQLYLHKNFNKENLSSYVTARIARIFPLYFTILIASLIISNSFYPDFYYDFRNPILFFRSIFFIGAPYELWTIPIEVQFYVCFLLFWYVYKKEKPNKVLLILIPILTFIPSLFVFFLKHRVSHEMPTFSLFFFFGVLIAVWKDKGVLERLRKKIPPFLNWLVLLIILFNVDVILKLSGADPIRLLPNISSVLLISIFFFLVAIDPSRFSLLRTKPAIFLGEISFGFYLIHRPVLEIINKFEWPAIFVILVSFALTIACAYLMYRFIEFPMRKLINSIFKKNNSIKAA